MKKLLKTVIIKVRSWNDLVKTSKKANVKLTKLNNVKKFFFKILETGSGLTEVSTLDNPFFFSFVYFINTKSGFYIWIWIQNDFSHSHDVILSYISFVINLFMWIWVKLLSIINITKYTEFQKYSNIIFYLKLDWQKKKKI